MVTSYNKLSIEQLTALSQRGDRKALGKLGACYFLGDGVTENQNKAFELLNQAADKGDGLACVILGWCYYSGEGVTKDLAKTDFLFNLATKDENADIDTLEELANIFRNGIGVQKYISKSNQLLRRVNQIKRNEKLINSTQLQKAYTSTYPKNSKNIVENNHVNTEKVNNDNYSVTFHPKTWHGGIWILVLLLVLGVIGHFSEEDEGYDSLSTEKTEIISNKNNTSTSSEPSITSVYSYPNSLTSIHTDLIVNSLKNNYGILVDSYLCNRDDFCEIFAYKESDFNGIVQVQIGGKNVDVLSSSVATNQTFHQVCSAVMFALTDSVGRQRIEEVVTQGFNNALTNRRHKMELFGIMFKTALDYRGLVDCTVYKF